MTDYSEFPFDKIEKKKKLEQMQISPNEDKRTKNPRKRFTPPSSPLLLAQANKGGGGLLRGEAVNRLPGQVVKN